MVAYLKKPKGSEGFHQIVDFLNASHIRYALTENLTIYVSYIQQFWQTVTARTLDNGEIEITATIDGKLKTVTEASVRRHLQLADAASISNLPTTEVFEQLALMGYKKTAWEQFSSNIANAIICLATNRTFNFSKLIFDGMRASKGYSGVDIPLFPTMIVYGPIVQGEGSTVPVKSHYTPNSAPSTSQIQISPTSRSSIRQETKVPQPSSPPNTNVADEAASTGVDVRHGGTATTVTSLDVGQGSGNIDKTPSMPQDSPLPRKVSSLETYLKQTKLTYGAAYTKLIQKVKKLENKVKSNQTRRRARIVVSDDEEDLEDPSKQGRKISEIDQDPTILLVKHDVEIQGRQEHDMEFEFDLDTTKDVSTAEEDIITAKPVSTVGAAVTTASVDVSTTTISTANPEVKIAGDSGDDIAAETLVYIIRSVSKAKDKGKGIMEESESTMTKTKRQQEQERLGLETAVRLQEEFDEEERQRIARVHEAASSFNVEELVDIQAKVEADEELAQRLQAEEREMYSEVEQVRMLVEVINQRKRYFAAQRSEERMNKPPTQAQQRTYMSNYIKHMGSHTLQQLKGYSFDEIKTLFETTMRRVNTFVPIESKIDRVIPESTAGSSKRDAEEELAQESSKRQKTGESSVSAKEPKDKEEEMSLERLQQMMIIVPEQGMNVEALQTKEDLVKLWSLVKEKFNSTEPTEDKEIEIWVELKRLFKPDTYDELWKLQKHIHNLTWRLYDSYGVHHVSTKEGIDIYMLIEKEYPLSRGTLTQMLVAKILVDQYNKMSRELLRKIFMQAERPRR
ncbi:hypothetical protein Tco_0944950 [Tanacetum coccineum]